MLIPFIISLRRKRKGLTACVRPFCDTVIELYGLKRENNKGIIKEL